MNQRRAFTLIELLVVIAALLLLFVVLIPSVYRAKRARDQRCRYNLQQIGLAFKTWCLDSSDSFDIAVPVNSGGAKERVEAGQAFFAFLVMSNELGVSRKPGFQLSVVCFLLHSINN